MYRAVRWIVSVLVGGAIAAFAALVSDATLFLSLSIFLLYAVSTAVALAHRDAWMRGSRSPKTTKSRLVGGIGAGVGGFVTIALVQISIPVGVAGYGTVIFGMSLMAASVST